ncbi:PfkB family carbohydrate kinase [Noviherbaspirillum aridicola]|uniref:Ribokinase n=1 Tax=Noviherbaspirillum aridicola TaxID=2849687 RepID=A0ABQ4Q483_9BURK|nr:PfkB family carbohydrate kinase [Noviherbaspirillum aridicola]GIZ51993.1 ribokinase [Noviherbaspirillum aridicola]
MTRVICIGNTTLDKIWPLTQLPTTGGKYRASDYLEVGGGMAANAAVAVARLGGNAAYWGRAGDDSAGRTMVQEMTDYGVDVSQFRLFAGARSSTSAILVSGDGERAIVNFRGAGVPDDAGWLPLEEVRSAQAVLADIRWVEGDVAVLGAARAAGIPTVLDGEIATAAAWQAVLPLVDHAIFSEPGLRSFMDTPIETDADRIAALRKVRTLGCRMAAVTRGGEGTIWLDETGIHFQMAFTVDVVDTTGAGDVFHGAYALALGEGQAIPQAVRFASAVAALKCTRRGGRAGIPTRAEVESFLADQGGRHMPR